MDREAWRPAVCGVTKSRTRLSHWKTATILKNVSPLASHGEHCIGLWTMLINSVFLENAIEGFMQLLSETFKKNFFSDVDHFKAFIEFVTISPLFYVWLLGPEARGIRDPTHIPCVGSRRSNHCTTREVPNWWEVFDLDVRAVTFPGSYREGNTDRKLGICLKLCRDS